MATSKNTAVKKWIGQFLASCPPRAKSVVMTLFGDAIMPHGGQLWLGSLIELLAPFGISDRLVRTSVFRLTEEGWLDAQRSGRRSLYALNAAASGRFEHAYQRVYATSDKAWDGQWTLVLATASRITAQQRAGLRKELLWEGFGTIAPAIYCHPRADARILDEIIERLGGSDTVIVCSASESSSVAGRSLRDLVTQGWQLDTIVSEYERYISHFSGLPDLLLKLDMFATLDTLASEQAFVLRTLAIHEFRRVQLHDPQLPPALLPTTWPGRTAYDLCQRIYRATFAAAETHLLATMRREDAAAPDAAPYFYQRFGGLGNPPLFSGRQR